MAPALFLDLKSLNLDTPIAGSDEIEAINLQRGPMRQLDGILYEAPDGMLVVGYKDVRDDEFWVEGHIPGRPILPGVLMIEAAAQLAAYMIKKRQGLRGFLGFTGCEEVKFRGLAVPGQRLILLGKEIDYRPRRFICAVQGVVEGALVFEANIRGMPL